jgi:hypothetical protein
MSNTALQVLAASTDRDDVARRGRVPVGPDVSSSHDSAVHYNAELANVSSFSSASSRSDIPTNKRSSAGGAAMPVLPSYAKSGSNVPSYAKSGSNKPSYAKSGSNKQRWTM